MLKKTFLPLLFLLLFSGNSTMLFAQSHHNFWFRAGLKYNWNPKVAIDGEFHHRRQNNFNNQNPFSANLRLGGRVWIHYKLNKEFKLSFSPIAYYANNKIIEQASDRHAPTNKEIRTSLGLSYQKTIWQELYFLYQTRYEYRNIQPANSHRMRWRNSFGLGYQLNDDWGFIVSNELLLNTYGMKKGHLYDQNRTTALIKWKGLRPFSIDLGYMRLNRLPSSSNQKINENNLLFYLTYQIK